MTELFHFTLCADQQWSHAKLTDETHSSAVNFAFDLMGLHVCAVCPNASTDILSLREAVDTEETYKRSFQSHSGMHGYVIILNVGRDDTMIRV